MKIYTQAITGEETLADDVSPYSALVAFYAAFNQRNQQLMQHNWLQSEQASMSNPLGGVKRGWQQISQVYEKIFHGEARVYVEFYDYSIHQGADMFCAVGRERGELHIDQHSLALEIRTSRIYCRNEGRWQQLHHHGSMDRPQLLLEYQNILLGK